MSDGSAPGGAAVPRRTARRGMIVGVVAFVAGLAAMALAVTFAPRWRAENAAPRPVAVVAPTVPAAQPTLATLAQREQLLSGQIAQMEARLANVGQSAGAASGNATRAEGLLVAFAARRALDRGLRLGYVEGQLRDRFGMVEPAAVAAVIDASRDPLTIEELRLGLDTIAPDLVSGTASDGWWRAFKRAIGGLVVLRREATPSPVPADRLLRARRLLDGGQVEGALAEVAQMPGAARAESWMGAAKRYIEARRALDRIESVAIVGQPAAPPVQAAPAPTPPLATDVPGLGNTAPAAENSSL